MYPLDVTHVVLRRWRAGVWGRNRSSDRYGAGAPACLRRQACSCPSHSDVLSHACCQACVELCLLGREGPVRLSHRIVHHAMAKQLPLSQDVLWTRHSPVVCFICLSEC